MILNEEISIERVMNAVAAGTTAQKASITDTAGYDGVMFALLTGDVADTSVITLKAAVDDVNNTAGMTLLSGAGATFTANATTADNKILVIDVPNPRERYVEAQVTRATANAVIDGMIAIRYKARSKPTTHAASVIAAFEYGVRAATV